jgi:hypothetical protein
MDDDEFLKLCGVILLAVPMMYFVIVVLMSF